MTDKDLVQDSANEVSGFSLLRRQWTGLNRALTMQERSELLFHKWKFKDSPNCDCGEVLYHQGDTLQKKPPDSHSGDMSEIDQGAPNAVKWLSRLKIRSFSEPDVFIFVLFSFPSVVVFLKYIIRRQKPSTGSQHSLLSYN